MKIFSKKIVREFSRYLVAGAIAFAVDFSILVFLTEVVKTNFLVANIFSFCCGLITTYLFSIYWVFEYRKISDIFPEFGIFTLITLFGFATNELCLWVAANLFGLHYTYGKIIATGFTFSINFALRKYLLFR